MHTFKHRINLHLHPRSFLSLGYGSKADLNVRRSKLDLAPISRTKVKGEPNQVKPAV